jgi:hypothetical protein
MSNATSSLASRRLAAHIAQFFTPYILNLIAVLTVIAGLRVIR